MADESPQSKRRRIAYACDVCRAKKSRCDGAEPICGPCRGRAATCIYSPHKSRVSVTQDYVDNLKAKNELLQQQLATIKAGDGLVDHTSSATDAPDVHVTLQGGSTEQSHAAAIQDAVLGLQDLRQTAPRADDVANPEYFGESSTFNFMTKACSPRDEQTRVPYALKQGQNQLASTPLPLVTLSQHERSPVDAMLSLDADDLYSLPSRSVADRMVDAYFEYRHPLNPYLHQWCFRERYNRLWLSGADGGEEPTQDNLAWIALVNMVFAFGSEYTQLSTSARQTTARARLFNRAKTLVFSSLLKTSSVELVQALLLMGHYLHGSLELNSCWTIMGLANRTAQGLGLHLDPGIFTSDTIEKEVRKRVWWGTFVMDRLVSFKVGRAPTITDGIGVTTALPLAVDDEFLKTGDFVPTQPPGLPSKLDFFIEVISQSRLSDRILNTLYNHELTTGQARASRPVDIGRLIASAVKLDGALSDWEQALPKHLHFGLEAREWHFQRQGSVLLMRFLHSRLLVHRQVLLVSITHSIEDQFQRTVVNACVRRCVTAAHETITAMAALRQQKLQSSFWHNSHYVFSAVGVLLVFHASSPDKSIGVPAYIDLDRDIAQGTALLEDVGKQMHSTATRYAESLRQLQARLRASTIAPGEPTRTWEVNGSQVVNGNQSINGRVPSSHVPSHLFDINATAIDDLFYSPSWTGLFEDWTYG